VRGSYFRSIEDVVISISRADKQIVGLTSPEQDNVVASIAHGVADFLARSGRSVLLIQFNGTVDGRVADGTVSDLSERRNLVHRRQGLDCIALVPSADSPYAFSDTAKIRSALEGLLTSYQFIILELGPVVAGSAATLNPVPAAAACDHLLLTCRRGMKRSLLEAVAGKLRTAHCAIGGIILNDTCYLTAGTEIANAAYWVFWPLPWLRKRVQKWATNSDLLN
jgi:hypothetical protein